MAREGWLSGASPFPNPPERPKMTTKKKTTIKTSIHNIFSTDLRMEEEGAWVEVNAMLGLKVKVRRMQSDAAVKAYEKLVREELGEGKARKGATDDPEKYLDILKDHLAQNILCDWKGVRNDDTGELIEYSAALSRELMEIKDFREFVLQAANQRDTYREKADADAEGN